MPWPRPMNYRRTEWFEDLFQHAMMLKVCIMREAWLGLEFSSIASAVQFRFFSKGALLQSSVGIGIHIEPLSHDWGSCAQLDPLSYRLLAKTWVL
jgi:hypothetical protein